MLPRVSADELSRRAGTVTLISNAVDTVHPTVTAVHRRHVDAVLTAHVTVCMYVDTCTMYMYM